VKDPATIAATVAALRSALAPRSVVDIGSSDERWATAFHDAGTDVIVVRAPGRPAVAGGRVPTLVHDPGQPLTLPRRFDLALSIGGPGQVPADDALGLVAALCDAAAMVAFAREVPKLVPSGTVSAPRPLQWDALFAHHGFAVQDAPAGDLVLYARSDRVTPTVAARHRTDTPDAAAWRLLRKQLLDSESRADARHRDTVLLWAALVATQRQLVAARYRLLRTPSGERLDPKTLLVRAATGALPLRRGLRTALGPPARLWDRRWYLARYPDVATARLSPLWHYRRHGAPTRRSPHQWVDPAWYAAHNPDVVATGEDPVEHYFRTGGKEGRDPHPLFATRWYESQCDPGETWRQSPLQHYLRRGRGRSPHPLVDPDFYRRSNPDVAATGDDPVEHFLTRGWFEGRDPHPLFDVRWYLESYVDVAREGLNPLVHYLAVGWEQGCDPHPLFDTRWYLKTYPDVAQTGREPLTHYVTAGAAEGRSPGPLFDTAWYVERHPDAVAGGRNPLAYFLTTGVERGDAPGPWAEEEELFTDLASTRALLESVQM
jgi:hypothetical protein